MIIRKFQEKDLDAVLKLFEEVVHSVAAKYYDPEQLQAWAPRGEQDRANWLNSLLENITYVAEDHSRIIAFGDMTKDGYVDRLYVDQRYQGSGVSQKIYQKLEESARQLGLRELTCDASIMGKVFAERQGFVVVKEYTKVHRGVEFRNFLMRKVLF